MNIEVNLRCIGLTVVIPPFCWKLGRLAGIENKLLDVLKNVKCDVRYQSRRRFQWHVQDYPKLEGGGGEGKCAVPAVLNAFDTKSVLAVKQWRSEQRVEEGLQERIYRATEKSSQRGVLILNSRV